MSDIIIYKNNNEYEEIWANDLVKDEQVNFEGWLCGIGLESIDIKSNGDMYRGTCRAGGKIGHVDDEVWNMPIDFIECGKTSCTCVADIKSTRYKDENVRKSLKNKIHENIVKKHGNKNSTNY
jgi:hypothetical protein